MDGRVGRSCHGRIGNHRPPLTQNHAPQDGNRGIGDSPLYSTDNAQFRSKAKALYEFLAADLKARCIAAFGITDPVDVKIQNGLKDELASVVRTDLEGVEALAQFYLADFRKKGFTLAVRFLENYLKTNAAELSLSRDEALSFPDVRNAVRVNIARFWQINLIAPKTDKQGLKEVEAITNDRSVNTRTFTDKWVRGIPSRALENWVKSEIGLDVDPQSGSIGFGAGGSNLESTGNFDLQRKGDRIAVTIMVTHVWSDPGFDFNKRQPFYEESQILERHKKAKPFPWKATWDEVINWEIEIVDAFTPRATRRIIGFDAMPPDEDISP